MADPQNDYSALYDGSGTTAGSLMPGGAPAKPDSPWKKVNIVIGVLLYPVGFILSVGPLGITMPLWFAMLIGSILLVIAYRIWKKHGRGRVLVAVLRPLVIAVTAAYLLAPWVLICGGYVKWMYPVKRFVYANGVNSKEFCDEILPQKLPKTCTDYKYFTQGQFPAQDYHPSMFLRFRTDTETMHQYAEQYRVKGFEPVELTPVELDENGEPYRQNGYLAPREIPAYALSFFDVTDDLRNAEVYYYDNHRGMALNYETGLVLYWT